MLGPSSTTVTNSYNSLKLWRGKAWHSTSLCRLKDTWMSQWLSSCNKYSLHTLWAAVLLPRSTHHAPSPGQDDPVVTLWAGGKSTSGSSSVKDFSNNLRWGPQDVSEELPKLAYPPQFPLQQFPTAAGSQCCLTNPRRRSRNTISSPKPITQVTEQPHCCSKSFQTSKKVTFDFFPVLRYNANRKMELMKSTFKAYPALPLISGGQTKIKAHRVMFSEISSQ